MDVLKINDDDDEWFMRKSSSSDQLPDKYYSTSMIFNTIFNAYCVTRVIPRAVMLFFMDPNDIYKGE